MPLTAQEVAEIARLFEESDFEELRIEHEGFKLTLRRRGARTDLSAVTSAAAAADAVGGATAGAATAAPRVLAQRRSADAAVAPDPNLLEVRAPLVGIFYRAPKPGAAPYVEVGSEVQEDTVVGIIEVMKLMNGVRAEVRGRVVELLVEDGAAVEYAQVLLRVARGGGGG